MNDTTRTNADQTRAIVREHYARIARTGGGAPACCSPAQADDDGAPARAACCSPAQADGDEAPAQASGAGALGYTAEDAGSAPAGADLGLGCGNPTAIAALRPGETVLDLGAGGGFDCFLAARQVGPAGRVIGVDMTPEMVSRARANAEKVGSANVEFRLGEIEHLPVADATIDVILSNCVINLSPDKPAVFREAFRALRPGGRLAVSDVVATGPIPPELEGAAAAIAGCIGGAAPIEAVRAMLCAAGFTDVEVEVAPHGADVVGSWLPGAGRFAASATIQARKPGGPQACCGPECCA